MVSQPVDFRSITPEDSSDPALRTDVLSYGHTAKSYTINGVGNNDDDIPLQGIRVHTDFRKSVTRKR
ncbi:hypothetical protein E4U41_006201 [Claviceps citrina]|nr:hypothetical protein E4U41_006201 [Claviceps citrina]